MACVSCPLAAIEEARPVRRGRRGGLFTRRLFPVSGFVRLVARLQLTEASPRVVQPDSEHGRSGARIRVALPTVRRRSPAPVAGQRRHSPRLSDVHAVVSGRRDDGIVWQGTAHRRSVVGMEQREHVEGATIVPDYPASVSSAVNGTKPRDPALDGVKGLAAIAVLVQHLVLLSYTATAAGVVPMAVQLAQVAVYQYLFRLSVPVFYLVSLNLLLSSKLTSLQKLRRRFARIGSAIAVWFLVYWVAKWPASAPPSDNLLRAATQVYRHGSLYFLVNLMVLSALAEGLVQVERLLGHRGSALLVWGGLITSMVGLGVLEASLHPLPFWHICNFIPYVFAARLLRSRSIGIVALLLGGALVMEAYLLAGESVSLADLPLYAYGRPVVVTGALALMMAALALPPLVWKKGLRVIGRYSLGVYLVHPLFIDLLRDRMPYLSLNALGGTWILRAPLALAVSLLTGGAVLCLSRTRLRALVC